MKDCNFGNWRVILSEKVTKKVIVANFHFDVENCEYCKLGRPGEIAGV